MSNKIHDAFAGLHMDPARAAKIEHALRQAQAAPGYTAVPFRESRRSRLFTLSAAACLLAVILLVLAVYGTVTSQNIRTDHLRFSFLTVQEGPPHAVKTFCQHG